MKNSRRINRRHLFFYLQVREAQTNKLIGYVVDITPYGLRVVSDQPFEPNRETELTMHLPDEMGKKKIISFNAKSIWNGKDVNSDFWAIGFEIGELGKDTLEILEEMITEYGFEEFD